LLLFSFIFVKHRAFISKGAQFKKIQFKKLGGKNYFST